MLGKWESEEVEMQAVKKDFLSLSLQKLQKLQPSYKVAKVCGSGDIFYTAWMNIPFATSLGLGGAGQEKLSSAPQNTKAPWKGVKGEVEWGKRWGIEHLT